mmetsp:Transcript_11480/g.23506  ORF Transcript_11480/g.23506 Transcript_11480/m.23506 type:complete len:235 (-) Transcript_11480:613-1317(-)
MPLLSFPPPFPSLIVALRCRAALDTQSRKSNTPTPPLLTSSLRSFKVRESERDAADIEVRRYEVWVWGVGGEVERMDIVDVIWKMNLQLGVGVGSALLSSARCSSVDLAFLRTEDIIKEHSEEIEAREENVELWVERMDLLALYFVAASLYLPTFTSERRAKGSLRILSSLLSCRLTLSLSATICLLSDKSESISSEDDETDVITARRRSISSVALSTLFPMLLMASVASMNLL